jgi:hypothetical protein
VKLNYKITERQQESYVKNFSSEEDFEQWLEENYDVVESFEKLN